MIFELGGLTLLVGIAAFYIVPLIRESRKRRRWSRVSAEVLEHRLRERAGEGFAEYRVRYTWNGTQHERFVGWRRKRGASLDRADRGAEHTRAWLRRTMARRPVGSFMRIEVDPANPGDAYVDELTVEPGLIAWILGAVFLLFFLVFAFIVFA
jgi:hypothetical protein